MTQTDKIDSGLKTYKFVKADELKSVYDIAEISGGGGGGYNELYLYFKELNTEVLYVMEKGALSGVIALSDMERYYQSGKKTELINRRFSYVSHPSAYEEAQEFFQKVTAIHEVPVIQTNIFLGVIRKKQDKADKQLFLSQIRSLQSYRWQMEKLKEFNRLVSCKILYYSMLGISVSNPSIFSQKDISVLKKRKSASIKLIHRLKYMNKEEQKKFFGKCYHEKYVDNFMQDCNQLKISQKKGIYSFKDCNNESFHIVDGYRRISNIPEHAKRKIWLFGLCTIIGYFARDDETIGYYLQDNLISQGYTNYEIVNAGISSIDSNLSRMFTEKISADDIVVFVHRFDGDAFDRQYKGDLNTIYEEIESPLECMVDDTVHCNYLANQKIAKRIFKDLLPDLTKDDVDVSPRIAIQDYFIHWDVIAYYKEYAEKYELSKLPGKVVGAIVMNCNPFTLGHRYLIEYASKRVDFLYVFVVEEDKSYFRFEDRFDMVKEGTKDLKNVRVLPSGKYIISKDTFSQYFEKDQVIDEVDDMDYDVRIFGEVVADILGISCRFAGEEPFDQVTKKYNETMKRILPEYQVEFIEIPRKKLADGEVISATRARYLLDCGKWDELKEILPSTTLHLLQNEKPNV